MNPFSKMMNALEGMSRRPKLYTVIAIQLVLLFSVILSAWSIDWKGEEILLKTEPVDPFDLFRGDYVILGYDINTLNASLLADLPTEQIEKDASEIIKRNTPVYVVLEPGDKYYEAVSVYTKQPNLQLNQKMIRGKVDYAYERNLFISYGIERYYLEEKTGEEVEKIREKIDVVVKVTPAGRAKVDHLELDGKQLPY